MDEFSVFKFSPFFIPVHFSVVIFKSENPASDESVVFLTKDNR